MVHCTINIVPDMYAWFQGVIGVPFIDLTITLVVYLY